jgi:hypothetical protein
MTIDLRKEHVSLRQEADSVMYAEKLKSEAQSALIESVETTLGKVGKSIQLSILENRVDFCRLYQQQALSLLETARAYMNELRELAQIPPKYHSEPWTVIQTARKKAQDTFDKYLDFEDITIISR